MAILQHTGQEIAVLASSAIDRPRDLDGKTYAGFGYPERGADAQGGDQGRRRQGRLHERDADTAAYEALYAKQADFAIIFAAWEGVEAKQRGIELRTFKFTDYGFPDFYQVVLACDRDWLAREPDLAKRFVGATVRGFEFAAAEPDAAAAILVQENPGVFEANPELPARERPVPRGRRLLVDAQGNVGPQTLRAVAGLLAASCTTRGC